MAYIKSEGVNPSWSKWCFTSFLGTDIVYLKSYAEWDCTQSSCQTSELRLIILNKQFFQRLSRYTKDLMSKQNNNFQTARKTYWDVLQMFQTSTKRNVLSCWSCTTIFGSSARNFLIGLQEKWLENVKLGGRLKFAMHPLQMGLQILPLKRLENFED